MIPLMLLLPLAAATSHDPHRKSHHNRTTTCLETGGVRSASAEEAPPATISSLSLPSSSTHTFSSTVSDTIGAVTSFKNRSTSSSATTVSVNTTLPTPSTSASTITTTLYGTPEAVQQLTTSATSTGTPHRIAVPTASPPPDLAGCYSSPGGVQPNGNIDTGCGGMFTHMWDCIAETAPWTTPYDTDQSVAYQKCVCETSEEPFSNESVFYRNFTGCTHCITLARTPDMDFMTDQLQDVDNFCRSQNPNAFMFVEDFQRWTFLLSRGQSGVIGPLTEAMQGLRPLLTTRPPLANLAYGVSAPVDGSLAGVTPSLTTYTTPISSGTATITELVTWIPTEADATFDGASASVSAALEASKAMTSNLCMGRGPCSINDASLRRPPRRLLGMCGAFLAMLLIF